MQVRPAASSVFDGPLGLRMGQGAGLISLDPVKQGPWYEIGRLSKNSTVVANKAAAVFQSLPADTDWNTDYATHPDFADGPWKGCDRLTEGIAGQQFGEGYPFSGPTPKSDIVQIFCEEMF